MNVGKAESGTAGRSISHAR